MKYSNLFLLILWIIFSSALSAQSNPDCFDCHDDNELMIEKQGKEISLYVSPETYQQSAHQDMDCIDCHVDFDPEELPHKEKILPVDCSTCHDQTAEVFHSSKHSSELDCSSCHQNVHAPEKKKAIAALCGDCHDDTNAKFKSSVHYANGSNGGPSCFSCHSPHSTSIASSETCIKCHGEKTFEIEHSTDKGAEFILNYKESIHGAVIECSDCHGAHAILAVNSSKSRINRQNLVNTCSKCHDDIAENFLKSEHGKAFETGFTGAPNCTDCHGEHDIRQITDSRSKVSRQHEIEVCMKCHLDSPEVQARMTHSAGFVAGYENSIHGRALSEGNLDAAVCSDCHGGHDEMKASTPASKVNKFNITSTCRQCHGDITEKFEQSVHGKALAQGITDSPTCTDCHGEHEIIEHTRKDSPVAQQNVSEKVCGPCHSSVRLTEKFGISSDRYSAYSDSYHGLAVRSGGVSAANCASCHSVHDILPSSDPMSSIHKENLATTCGTCHPGANENFAKGKVHITGSKQDDKLIYWISTIYIFMIVGTIGAMSIHNFLDWIRKLINRFQERYKPVSKAPRPRKTNLYVRMTLNERIQHILLAVSFLVLVFTGFMLKFPDAFWVIWIREIGGEPIFAMRGLVHRIAAVVMVADSLYHTYYIIFTKRGRQFIRDIMFRLQDIRDMIRVLRYNLGLSKIRPKFDRFNYIEKSEYWALIWGTVVMTVTGFALWFENQFMGWFSKLFVDVCETIHYFEAWLAFLAIVVWHFYYVIFNPDVYPMSFAWLTGKITEEEMEHEHPLELERIKEKQQRHVVKETQEVVEIKN
jgi:formate dehydrogenase gamma subunit